MNSSAIGYQLIVHDFGNLAVQCITSSEEEKEMKQAAENLNNLFDKSGYSGNFEADVITLYMCEQCFGVSESSKCKGCNK